MIRNWGAYVRSFTFFAVASMTLTLVAARAQESQVPVPRVTIYPGDQITDQVLEEKNYRLPNGADALVFLSRTGLVGKVARRTLLPGQPIPTIAVDNPHVVKVGAQVRIVFSEGGMQITTYGVAQQAGAVGDVIRVRNQESGLFISGRVQSDGSILVSEG
ncbi:flagellar basal body P-ring formation chaperone FlgA [Methylocystis sp. WRRC1]|uniref:flagellar basal body P-ring formation chaperone FlgA n=1 Tax=Methylocystis sp. WRRC1 TaxID=1732014 RepID=UPI001D15CD1C|nr:flagellar basal body P-ring formation chaperone FlgA [Methylocystis sp. WRRC1]MCC3244643.1 flagellar basal body P-ring formation chaperone FlgA [Methylocystis sp. WRRC1]